MKMVGWHTAVAMFLVATPDAVAFEMDMTPAEVRAARKEVALIDLAVGERGLVYPIFCVHEGKLVIPADLKLQERRLESATNWIAVRQSGGGVAFEVVSGTKEMTPLFEAIGHTLASSNRRCDPAIHPEELLPVTEVNGMTTMSEALGQ